MHETVEVQVWADVDVGIAECVRWLNSLPGVRTFASCQGTIGEGGASPYGPYIKAWWPEELDGMIREKFNVGESGDGWAEVYPKLCNQLIPSDQAIQVRRNAPQGHSGDHSCIMYCSVTPAAEQKVSACPMCGSYDPNIRRYYEPYKSIWPRYLIYCGNDTFHYMAPAEMRNLSVMTKERP